VTAGAKPSGEGAAEGAPAAVKPKVEEADAPLPPGWARAKDAQGRTYYWHTQVCWRMAPATHLCTACDAASTS
jgi:WW domain